MPMWHPLCFIKCLLLVVCVIVCERLEHGFTVEKSYINVIFTFECFIWDVFYSSLLKTFHCEANKPVLIKSDSHQVNDIKLRFHFLILFVIFMNLQKVVRALQRLQNRPRPESTPSSRGRAPNEQRVTI